MSRRFRPALAFAFRRASVEKAAERVAAFATTPRARLAGRLLLVAGLGFVGLRLWSIWHDNHVLVGHVAWSWFLGALVVAVAAVLCSALIWLEVLRRLEGSPRLGWARIFLRAQLGKYVPGSVWQYAGRGALARAEGIPVRMVGRSIRIELIASTCAAVPFSLLLLGWWAIPGVVGVLGAIALVGMAGPWKAIRTASAVTLLYAAMWPLVGASFWMTGRALAHVPIADAAFYTGTFATAWLVGLFAIYAPGGLGVREVVLIGLLHSRLGGADAALVAVASRAVFTAADLAGACVGVIRRQPFRRVENAAVRAVSSNGSAD